MKGKTSHVANVVYEGKCICGKNCDIGKNYELGKHLYQFPEHRFNGKIIRRVPKNVRQRKIHEACYVMCLGPTLNNQLEVTSLTLFQNGVT